MTASDATQSTDPSWYPIYCAAVLENNRVRALPQIELAIVAIDGRMKELRAVPPSHSREEQDLRSALTYLEILLQQLGTENERLLWD